MSEKSSRSWRETRLTRQVKRTFILVVFSSLPENGALVVTVDAGLVAGEAGEGTEESGKNGDGVRDRICRVLFPSARVHVMVLHPPYRAKGLQRVLALFSDPQLLPGVHQQLH